MDLFSSNKTKAKAPKAKSPKTPKAPKVKRDPAPKASSAKVLADSRLENALTAPWLSEKALIGTEKGVYVFQVPVSATKTDVSRAIERIYKVVPRQVNIVNVRGKVKALRSRRGYGTRVSRRKAYVFLKKGETIQFA